MDFVVVHCGFQSQHSSDEYSSDCVFQSQHGSVENSSVYFNSKLTFVNICDTLMWFLVCLCVECSSKDRKFLNILAVLVLVFWYLSTPKIDGVHEKSLTSVQRYFEG